MADVAGFASQEASNPRKTASCAASAIACYIEACGIAPSSVAGALGARAGLYEAGEVRVHPTGTVTVFTGSHVARPGPRDHLRAGGRRPARARRSRTSTSCTATPSKVLFGMGTYGSRSIAVGGTAIVKALDKIVAKGKKIAAHLLEAAEADIEYDRGTFKVAGTDRKKTFGEVAFAAYVPHNYPLDKLEPGPERERLLRPDQLHLPRRQLRLRGRDRPRHRRGHAIVALHRGGRLRQDHQPDDRRGPGARRARAGHRPGAARGLRLRPETGQLAHRLVHGLRDAARGRPADASRSTRARRRARTTRSA